jgi:hypothetical protein
MSQAWLSYDKAPPLWLPAGFFAAGLCWLLALALLLPLDVPEANRYLPQMLALTHILALGVLGNAMLGALLQILAVVAGVPTPRPAWLLAGIGLPWQVGTALLVGAFLAGMSPWMLETAAACLLAALGVLLWHALAGLLRSPARDASSLGMRSALIGLAVAVALGGLLVLTLTGRVALPLEALLASHVLWAGIVWLFGLILAVSQTVIPMFLVTPPFPRTARVIGASLLPLAALITLARFAGNTVALYVTYVLIGAALAGFAVVALRLLQQSRRPADPARRQWQFTLLCLIAALGCGFASLAWPGIGALPLAAGLLWLGGFGLGAVLNMQCKILPFLFWLHLKALGPPRGALPSTHGFLSEAAQARIVRLHRGWLVVGLVWCVRPDLAGPVLALATLLLVGLLGHEVWRMTLRYRTVRRLCLPD